VENLITSELDANLSTKVPSKRLLPLQRQPLMTNSTTIYHGVNVYSLKDGRIA